MKIRLQNRKMSITLHVSKITTVHWMAGSLKIFNNSL